MKLIKIYIMIPLPEKFQEFQKLVKYLAITLGYSPMLFKLAKMIRDEVMRLIPHASTQYIIKKSMKYFDDNRISLTITYMDLKSKQ